MEENMEALLRNQQLFPEPITQPSKAHPAELLDVKPFYTTSRGAAYLGDSFDFLKKLPEKSVDLVFTSPPYALEFQKEYGNVSKDEYIEWFLPYAFEIKRILKDDGSFVLNIGGSYEKGRPTRSLYHYKLLIALCEEVGFYLAQECFWFNPARLPSPAEWVNVRRIRIKDSVEFLWWLSVSPYPKADNKKVLVPYSDDMLRLLKRGYREARRPSGHNITSKFMNDHGGAIPPNLIEAGNNDSNSYFIKCCKELGLKIHPARFPPVLPEFFVKFLTDEEDIVVDPFAGSNTTGWVAESLNRRWLAFEINEEYLRASAVRFDIDPFSI